MKAFAPSFQRTPIAVAMAFLLPLHASAYTAAVNSGAVVYDESVGTGLQSIGTNGTAHSISRQVPRSRSTCGTVS